MSISDTIGTLAASNPVVGAAVARQSVSSAILSGLQSGEDSGTAALLGAVSNQAEEASRLLSSLTPNLGQNVSTSA